MHGPLLKAVKEISSSLIFDLVDVCVAVAKQVG